MDIADVIAGIVRIREYIHEKNVWSNPLKLSEAMTKLAVYNAYLADHIAPAHKHATDTSYRLFKVARDSGASASAAEVEARGESTEEREEYENLKNIYKATENMISVIQSRLRVVEGEMKRQNIQS